MGVLEWLKQTFIDDLLVNMDWVQFIPSLIATFVGIFVPFLVQRRKDNANRIKEAVQHLENIKEEMTSTVKKGIEEIRAENFERVHLTPIETPIWTGLLNSNGVIVLSDLRKHLAKLNKKKNQNSNANVRDDDWYERIFMVYGSVDKYNQWWNLYTDKVFDDADKVHGAAKSVKNIEDGIIELSEKLCNDYVSAQEDAKKAVIPQENIPYLITLIELVIDQASKNRKKPES